MWHTAFQLVFAALCAFLYRWGGGGFQRLPAPFNRGEKAARRYGIPLALFGLCPTPAAAVPLLMLCAVLHFNLEEIKARRWEEIFCWSAVVSLSLQHLAGWICWIPTAWWVFGVYWSNIGFPMRYEPLWFVVDGPSQPVPPRHRLDWFWVEIGMGLLIGLACMG